MKVINIKASGLPLFKEDLDIHFFASQRVKEGSEENLFRILPNAFLNNVSGFIGINASGKTTVLRTIDFTLHLLNNDPLNHVDTKDILGNTERAVFDIIFLNNQKQICRLVTTIRTEKTYINSEPQYSIAEEELYTKPLESVKYKKQLTDFTGCTDVVRRSGTEDFLSDDISIVIAMNKKKQDHVFVSSLLGITDVNVLEFTEEIPDEIIKFLDPSIESIYIDHEENGGQTHLKFLGQAEILLNRIEELNRYLSSGTIKGIRTFNDAIAVLQRGGYLLMDEIEDHFNREIVTTLIRFFMDPKVNQYGAGLIFSTHYPELLDEFSRNDCIYITRNMSGITVENLSSILKRNDIKKSDAYQSGFLEGTVPMYESYMDLRKEIQQSIKQEG